MIIKRLLMLVVLMSGSWLAHAGIDTYEFESIDDRHRYNYFIDVLRCPKCKNQNLAGSNAPIAQDLRRELHRLIIEQQSDKAIEKFMVDRYGDFVLYNPPLQKNTYILWYGPVGIILLGVFVLGAIVWRRAKGAKNASGCLTDGEQERLDAFFKQTELNQTNKK